MRNDIQLVLGVRRQLRALRQVLTQQALGVLLGPAFPGAVRIGKAHLKGEPV